MSISKPIIIIIIIIHLPSVSRHVGELRRILKWEKIFEFLVLLAQNNPKFKYLLSF
jgi:hypothetical protein